MKDIASCQLTLLLVTTTVSVYWMKELSFKVI